MTFLKLNTEYKSFIKYYLSPIKNNNPKWCFLNFEARENSEQKTWFDLYKYKYFGEKYDPILLERMALKTLIRMKRGKTLKLFEEWTHEKLYLPFCCHSFTGTRISCKYHMQF